MRATRLAKAGRIAASLVEFRRALDLDPKNKPAQEGLRRLHTALTLEQLAADPRIAENIDAHFCLERAASLLLEANPTAEMRDEATRLLELVLSQRPACRAIVQYWRAVERTHAKDLDSACAFLEAVLDPASHAADDAQRQSILFAAWQLGLMLHPELKQRVGAPQLALPGRRMEAIAAVEQTLSQQPEDAAAWDLKRIVYSDLRASDYEAKGPNGPRTGFDYDYARQLGLALIDDAERWRRGADFLSIAARGLAGQRPSIMVRVALAHQKHGDGDGARAAYEHAKSAGQAFGPKNLPESERRAYYTAVKALADDAKQRGDVQAAIDNTQIYAESVGSGLETVRTLADLYQQKGDIFAALKATEQGLLYSATDKDLLARKEAYYASISAGELRARWESVKGFFDAEYCLQTANKLLGYKDLSLEHIEWAQHLGELAHEANPSSIAATVIMARCLRRRGEIDQARQFLEHVYRGKPESFANGADEDAWYQACRLLGEAYLQESARPDLAVACLQAYRKSPKSGADTLFKLGQAYEQIGDAKRAKKCYEHVTSYDKHPLAPDAREALYRLSG
jgi:tetratricopeptide (TPR) repeat protein